MALRLLSGGSPYRNGAAAFSPDRHLGAAGDDPVRFGQLPSLAFAPSTIAQFVPASDGRPPRLLELFFGLLGPNGPLPLHLTDYARERMTRWHDPTLVRFLDVFHHRMLSLLLSSVGDFPADRELRSRGLRPAGLRLVRPLSRIAVRLRSRQPAQPGRHAGSRAPLLRRPARGANAPPVRACGRC